MAAERILLGAFPDGPSLTEADIDWTKIENAVSIYFDEEKRKLVLFVCNQCRLAHYLFTQGVLAQEYDEVCRNLVNQLEKNHKGY